MKRMIITFIAVFSMCCLVACGGETKEDAATGSSSEVVMNNEADTSVEATEEPSSEVVEATAEPTEEPQATPEPTEEPELYPGIDMESDLEGAQWIKTFKDVICEPKVVVFNDATGRKEIVEEGQKVTINPDEDVIAIYLPEGYKFANKKKGIYFTDCIVGDCYEVFNLDAEKMKEKKERNAALYVKCNGEEIAIEFKICTE